MAQYKTGTVSVTNGSATVTGSGTLWSGEIAAGDLFTIVGDNAWYEVASVGSNTSITLSANYAGTTGSGKSYAISRDFTTRLALPYPQKGDIETASIIKRAFEQIDTETNIATANYSATSAPTANDDSGDGYSIGSWWVNVTSDEAYLCVDATVGAAVWTKISVDVPSEIVSLLNNQSLTLGASTIEGLTIGKGAGAVSTNTAVGASALAANTSGGANFAGGFQALDANTTGANNIGIGANAMGANTIGSFNVAIGDSAMALNTTANDNVAIGQSALDANTTGASNVAIGRDALGANTTASYNTAVGYQAGYTNTTGQENTAVGYQALYLNSTGNGVTAVGRGALRSNTASNNTAFGDNALNNNTSGVFNTSVGNGTYGGTNGPLGSNTTGSYNTALGGDALASNTTASYTTAVGYQSGYANTTANYATYLGAGAGLDVTTGAGNCFVGAFTGQNVTTGSANTFVGGLVVGTSNGCGSDMTTGSKNTILGGYTGNQGGLDIRTASNYIVLSDGDGNPRSYINNTGNHVDVGESGDFVGAFCTKGTGSQTYVDFRLGWTSSTSVGTQTGYISTNGTGTTYNTTSDYRLKEDVKPMIGALAKVAQLKPVTYKWKTDGSDGEGFIAHELAEVCPQAVTRTKDAVDAEGNPVYQGIDTSFLVATLTAAIQELKSELDSVKAELATLKGN